MEKQEMIKAIEEALMFYARYGKTDTPVGEWPESQFNQVMTSIVRANE